MELKKPPLLLAFVEPSVALDNFQMDNDYSTWWLYMFGSFNHRIYIARAKLLMQSVVLILLSQVVLFISNKKLSRIGRVFVELIIPPKV